MQLLKMDTTRFVIVLLLFDSWESLVEARGKQIRTRKLYPMNFVSVTQNEFSEKQLRIGYNRVLSMETSTTVGNSTETDVVFQQMTDGRRLVQGVYQGGVLRECDFTKDYQPILDFVTDFIPRKFLSYDQQFGRVLDAYTSDHSKGNATLAFHYFKKLDFLTQLSRDRVNIKQFAKECHAFYKVAKRKARHEAKAMKRHKQIRGSSYLEKLEQFNYKKLTKPRLNDRKRAKRSTEPVKRSRTKRAALDFNSVLIFPGTKWCGKGDLAQCYDDLGEDQELDVCCRDHDCCPYVIPPFGSRFNIFNYRFHSLIHCECDNRFRGCLKDSPSTTANFIGRIYFNLLGSKCFEFQEKKVCTERSWWGKCQNYELQETAVVKSQGSYNKEINVNEMEQNVT